MLLSIMKNLVRREMCVRAKQQSEDLHNQTEMNRLFEASSKIKVADVKKKCWPTFVDSLIALQCLKEFT